LKEDAFKDSNTLYLYHGTKFENAFSIMRNGAKIGSKSKYFLNGAAYGDGIYLSNSINMSLGYSTGVQNYSTSRSMNINMVLFIFEVKKNPKKNNWLKSGNIFVVDDEDALILRFMMYFNNSTYALNQAIFTAIDKKLNTGAIQVQEKTNLEVEKKNITTIHNKRLMREFSIIKKQDPQVLGFNVVLTEEDNLKQWTIELFRVDNTNLEAQMKTLGIKHIEIEITFKENYPIEPPFIRVVHPHFKFRSGHITAGGSLCMEMLTNQGWSPTFNVENIITQIKFAISDGQGEIDEAHWNTRYTKQEAVEAFKRVLATHGWV
jgi:ubiquitin-protein ligase